MRAPDGDAYGYVSDSAVLRVMMMMMMDTHLGWPVPELLFQG